MSKLEKMDYAKIEALRAGPMNKREKFVVVVSAILVVAWVVQSIHSAGGIVTALLVYPPGNIFG